VERITAKVEGTARPAGIPGRLVLKCGCRYSHCFGPLAMQLISYVPSALRGTGYLPMLRWIGVRFHACIAARSYFGRRARVAPVECRSRYFPARCMTDAPWLRRLMRLLPVA